MSEHIEHIIDSFADYKGDLHRFVIVAVSSKLPTKILDHCNFDDGIEITHEVSQYVENYGAIEYIGNVVKTLKIGISICNPEDTFDEEIGIRKATYRAKQSDPALYSSKLGYINSRMVKALLEQEAEYLKNNPELFIKGYNDMKKTYLKNLEMSEMSKNFSKLEREVVHNVVNDPKFLDKIVSYVKWLRK